MIEFPDPTSDSGYGVGVFKDQYGQMWEHNGVAWVRKSIDPGIGEAPIDSQQYARQDAEWELVSADEWYLGAKSTPPIRDNFERSLVEGHTYYDTVSHTMFVWDGIEWDAFSGVSEIATLWEFRWDSLGDQTAPFVLDALHSRSPEDPNYPGYAAPGDDHGNIPFDQWIQGLIVVSMYKNGQRLIERRNLTPGYGEGDTATQPRPADEETGTNVPTYNQLLLTFPTGPTDPGNDVTYIVSTDGDKDIPNPGEGLSKEGFVYHWGEKDPVDEPGVMAWIRGGKELAHYDYIVDYPNQEITLVHDLKEGDTIVIETGTLAASQYIKTSFKNAENWDFVTHACDMGGNAPSRGLLVSQEAIACHVAVEVARAKRESTEALIGSVFHYAGAVAPLNSLPCDGRAVSIEHYPKLYAALGSTWNHFAGASNPGTGNFRIPFSEVAGQPLHIGSTQGANNVGTFLPSENKRHTHLHTHSHTGSVTSATGSHTHTQYWKTDGGVKLGGGKTLMNKLISKKEYDDNVGRSIHYHRIQSGVSNAGNVGSALTISQDSSATSSNGGLVARPNTAIMLNCIWVDLQG